MKREIYGHADSGWATTGENVYFSDESLIESLDIQQTEATTQQTHKAQ